MELDTWLWIVLGLLIVFIVITVLVARHVLIEDFMKVDDDAYEIYKKEASDIGYTKDE